MPWEAGCASAAPAPPPPPPSPQGEGRQNRGSLLDMPSTSSAVLRGGDVAQAVARRLMASTSRKRAMPGIEISQASKNIRPLASEIIRPHDGVGGCTPSPGTTEPPPADGHLQRPQSGDWRWSDLRRQDAGVESRRLHRGDELARAHLLGGAAHDHGEVSRSAGQHPDHHRQRRPHEETTASATSTTGIDGRW